MNDLSSVKSTISKFYDKTASWYATRDQGYRRKYFNAMEFGLLQGLDLARRDVLDVGTGVGRLPLALSKNCRSVAACDLSFEMVRIASERCTGKENVLVFQADAETLPMADRCTDLVTCFGLFEYIQRLDRHLDEFFRVLRPGGYLMFTCHNGEAWQRSVNPSYPISFHGWSALEGVLSQKGFEVVAHETTFHFANRWIMLFARILHPLKLSSPFIGIVLVVDKALKTFRWSEKKGRIHVILARRPES